MWLPEVEAIKAIKTAKRISIRELSEKTGITTANISRILSGKTRYPRPGTLRKIAEALGCLCNQTGGNMTTNLGLAIRVEMAKKSLSLRQLEKLTGITIANLSKISSGKTKRPKIETIEKIAAGLGIEVQPLLEALRQDKLIDAQNAANALIHNSKGSIGQVVNFSNIEAKKFSVQTAEMPSKDASMESTRTESECVVVYGSVVLPEIKDGDTVYFNETEQINDNDFVVAEAEDTTGPVVRKVLKGENGDVWLLATNPDWPGEKKLKAKRILGVVTERRTRVPRG